MSIVQALLPFLVYLPFSSGPFFFRPEVAEFGCLSCHHIKHEMQNLPTNYTPVRAH